MNKLIGRGDEIKSLQNYYESEQAEFVAIYGRRRVGKTFLISHVFEDKIDFETSGVLLGSKEEQFAAFNQSLKRIGYEGPFIHVWMDAFFALEQLLAPRLEDNKRHVIFIDELPCLDISGTRFVVALGHFWNSFVSKHTNLMLIVCGSATSWMITNIIDNHGGLHNRITHELYVSPFTLAQTEQYFITRGFAWDRLALLQIYMVFGGIPYYLSLINKEDSVSSAIDRLLFSPKGELHNEYNRLLASLFSNPEPYIDIVRELALHREGLTRQELVLKLKKSNGGNITKQLESLHKCDFITYNRVRGKKISKSGGIYTLADFFMIFYHTFMEQGTTDARFWSHNLISAKTNSFWGLAFERVCMTHIPQIKRALGIDGIATEYYSWRSKSTEERAQIDLLIERADRIINLCEVKYSTTPYLIDKSEDLKFRMRQAVFVNQTKTRYGIIPTFITTYGLAKNAYSSNVLAQITMDDLFKE